MSRSTQTLIWRCRNGKTRPQFSDNCAALGPPPQRKSQCRPRLQLRARRRYPFCATFAYLHLIPMGLNRVPNNYIFDLLSLFRRITQQVSHRTGGAHVQPFGDLGQLIVENGFAPVAAIHDVIDRPRIFDAKLSVHTSESAPPPIKHQQNMRLCGTDPFTISRADFLT